jgi:hypothetical protein
MKLCYPHVDHPADRGGYEFPSSGFSAGKRLQAGRGACTLAGDRKRLLLPSRDAANAPIAEGSIPATQQILFHAIVFSQAPSVSTLVLAARLPSAPFAISVAGSHSAEAGTGIAGRDGYLSIQSPRNP